MDFLSVWALPKKMHKNTAGSPAVFLSETLLLLIFTFSDKVQRLVYARHAA